MKKWTLFLAFVIFVAFATQFVVVPSPAYAAKALKVGIVDAFSGGAAPMGIDNLNGFKMVIEAVNAKGGVNGTKIQFVTRDDKFKPDVSLAMAKELVMKEGVDILLGTISSASTLAVSDFAKKEKIPFFVTGAKSEKITGEKGHRYIFQIDDNTYMSGKASAQVLAKKPFVKYWIMGDDMEYGHAITSAVWNNLKVLKPNVQLMGETWYKVGEADFGPYISQIMSAKPDCVILGAAGASIIGFMKAAKATGMNKTIPMYLHTAIDHTILLPNGLDSPEGVIGSAHYLFYYPDTPDNKAFVAEYRKLYNKYPTMPAFYGNTAAQFIVKALEKLGGKFDKEKFINAIEGMVLEKTAAGRIEMRACDHQALLPTFVGVTKKVPEYKDFLIATDIVAVAPKDGVRSCEEIQKLRATAK
ncbi:MAG: amino acid/amide transporter substrate-binding protein, family [Deltaproteobacteria bacterium]|nr:amino acid/amide transporter substrate-binding protein, family [Deltaproteobacteria bacterium]